MTTRIELINRSLQRIGASALQSEGAPNAEKLIRLYDDDLEFLTGLKPWRWSFSTVQLVRDLEGDAHPFWKYRYKYPSAVIGAPVAVFDRPRSDSTVDAGGQPFHDYELHERHIATDAETLFARFQVVKPIHFWPALFVEAMRLIVAGDAAKMLHEDDRTRIQLRREVLGPAYEESPGSGGLIGKLASRLSRDQPSETIMDEDGPLIGVRF